MNKRLWVKFVIGAALGLAMLAPAHAVPATNLLMNPGFESGTGVGVGGKSAFPGWNVSPNGSGFPTRYNAPKNGGFNASFQGSGENYGTLSQTVNVAAGHRLEISGYWRPSLSGGEGPALVFSPQQIVSSATAGLRVAYGNGIYQSTLFSSPSSSPLPNAYQFFDFTITAMGGPQTISFGAFNTSGYSALDDLSVMDLDAVAEVPEIDPKSAALPIAAAVAGLMILGDARKRKSS